LNLEVVELTNFEFSAALINQVDALLEIEERCFKTDNFNRRQLQYLLQKAKTISLVCHSAGRVHGYLLCLIPNLPRPARIYSLAVIPELRGLGIASSLLQRTLTKLRQLGYQRCRLEVRANDKKTQELYKRFDFRVISQITEYYGDGADALKMELNLNIKKKGNRHG
jgi:ribosomal protein S18 acetylase RimI-like enzyme